MLRVHHLNCATMCAPSPRLVTGAGAWFGRAPLSVHCLLIETAAHGLVLVDTGFGTQDCERMGERLGKSFGWSIGAPDGAADSAVVRERVRACALNQVAALGFERNDVRHIVLTHMDLDHAGGIADFPAARVHVMAAELAAARTPGFMNAQRYKPIQWSAHPDLQTYEPSAGERWRGFARVQELRGLPPELLMLPLRGHTEGHACIAVERPSGPLVHAGDAYFHRTSIATTGNPKPQGLLAYEWAVAVDKQALRDNHERLRRLAAQADIELFCAHDPNEFPGELAPLVSITD
jgi:glyoxylase-like metal-dependent hydrolase (beta-lactamase superfamily II)